MSDLHRHMPELAEAIYRIFFPETGPGVDRDVEFDTLREDIETCSKAALTPAGCSACGGPLDPEFAKLLADMEATGIDSTVKPLCVGCDEIVTL